MTDLEINKALAIAIGYKPEQMNVFEYMFNRELCYSLRITPTAREGWQTFNYRDWNVIGPIAAKYDCFPCLVGDENVGTAWRCDWAEEADTPQKAITLAVIQGIKK